MRSFKFSRLPARYWPLALVTLCGATLGHFLVRAYVAPLPRQYQLDFRDARWIEPQQFSPVAYFRKKVFLSVVPEQAWLQVAATDAFQVMVNGHNVGTGNALKTRVAGIYDIKAALTPGTNVIAVAVNRNTYPDSAQLLVSGAIRLPGHDPVTLLSGEDWRVTPTMGIVEGTEAWHSATVQDELWPAAHLVKTTAQPVHIDWVSTSPLLLQLPSIGSWLLARDAPREAIFSTALEANRSGQETWIQVASSGDLDLMINGKLVTSLPVAALNPKQIPQLIHSTVVTPKSSSQEPSSDVSTASVTASEPLNFQAYDISRWIRRGPNTIVAAVRSNLHPASFLADGFTIRKSGEVQRFGTDSTWQTLDIPSPADNSKTQRAIEAGRNGSAPWGYLRQGLIKEPRLTDFDLVAKYCATMLVAIIAVLLVWMLASWSTAVLRHESIRAALTRDALFHVPITVALLLMVLLNYDYRFPDNWSFQPAFCAAAIVFLAAARLLHFFASPAVKAFNLLGNLRSIHLRRALPYLLLAAIMVLGWTLRYHNLGFMSFDHDEMGIIQKSKGVFVRGFPYNEAPTRAMRPATTYELVGYFLAISGRIFGYSEWSMRLPSCIWGTLTIGVIGLMGRRLFNWRTGLITALFYACITLNIRWGQNAFYLQQCQFMGMLVFWLFYEAIRARPLQRKYLTAASVAFCLAFLSWEGCGLLLPALFVALLVVRWGEWWWLKEWHIYKCLFFIVAVVIGEFSWRTIMGTPPYLTVGSGLSNVAGPSLFFLNYHYQPTYYIEKLLLSENHVPFTIVAALGAMFCWRQPGFRYVVTLLVTLLFLYTNFLAALSPRYCYFYQPLLLLAAVAASVTFYNRLVALAFREGNSLVGQSFAHASGVAVIALLFLQSNEWLIKDYSLSGEGDAAGLMTRMNTYRYDYRSADLYVKEHLQPGDVIIPIVPHVFEYYTGIKGNFFLDTLLNKRVSYSSELAEPAFIDKFRGYPAIRDLTELLEATHRGRRTWIVFVPYGALKRVSSPDVLAYLDKNAKIVYESYRAKVFLIQGANSPAAVAQSNTPK